jgi:hypothetical protein
MTQTIPRRSPNGDRFKLRPIKLGSGAGRIVGLRVANRAKRLSTGTRFVELDAAFITFPRFTGQFAPSPCPPPQAGRMGGGEGASPRV